MTSATFLAALLGSACSPKPATPIPEPVPTEVPDPVPTEQPTEGTPATMYAECEGRVEGPQSDGECTSDADCVRTGCSNEVCTNASDGDGLTTTCEALPCFAVLDACGCSDGTCTWTLKSAMPEPGPGG